MVINNWTKNNHSNIFEWHSLEEIEKKKKHLRQIRLFPTCHWLFPTCHLSPWVPQMPLTALFHLLPSTTHRGTPTVRAKWKTTLLKFYFKVFSYKAFLDIVSVKSWTCCDWCQRSYNWSCSHGYITIYMRGLTEANPVICAYCFQKKHTVQSFQSSDMSQIVLSFQIISVLISVFWYNQCLIV